MNSTVARSFVHSAIALSVLASSIAPARAQTPPPVQPSPPPPVQPTSPPTPAPAPPAAPAPAPPPTYYPPPAAPQPGQPQAYPAPPPPQPYVAPTYPQSGLPPPRAPLPPGPPKPRKGLMIAGISVLSGFYLLSVTIGASIMDGEDDDPDGCRNCEEVGPWLFLPIAGPFVGATKTLDDAGWVVLGMGQVVGLGLMIGGIILYKNTKHAAEAPKYGEFDLGKGRSLALDVSTSGRMTGPRMTLRF